jgi:hypothetical protein
VPGTEVFSLVEGAKAEVYTVVIILAIVLVYTDSHDTMCKLSFSSLNYKPLYFCSPQVNDVFQKDKPHF